MSHNFYVRLRAFSACKAQDNQHEIRIALSYLVIAVYCRFSAYLARSVRELREPGFLWLHVHRGQTSEAFFVLFSGILFNIK